MGSKPGSHFWLFWCENRGSKRPRRCCIQTAYPLCSGLCRKIVRTDFRQSRQDDFFAHVSCRSITGRISKSMEARLIRPALLAALLMVSMGASYRSANFIVETGDPQMAARIAATAEQFRHDLAIEWLGQA